MKNLTITDYLIGTIAVCAIFIGGFIHGMMSGMKAGRKIYGGKG